MRLVEDVDYDDLTLGSPDGLLQAVYHESLAVLGEAAIGEREAGIPRDGSVVRYAPEDVAGAFDAAYGDIAEPVARYVEAIDRAVDAADDLAERGREHLPEGMVRDSGRDDIALAGGEYLTDVMTWSPVLRDGAGGPGTVEDRLRWRGYHDDRVAAAVARWDDVTASTPGRGDTADWADALHRVAAESDWYGAVHGLQVWARTVRDDVREAWARERARRAAEDAFERHG